MRLRYSPLYPSQRTSSGAAPRTPIEAGGRRPISIFPSTRLSAVLPFDALLLLALLPADDAPLVGRIRDGDHAAFQAFFEQHHRALLAFLARRGVPDGVADDLVQQAFVHLWEHRDRLDPLRSARAYLFRIAYTRALNHFRDTARLDSIPDESVGAREPDAASYALTRDAVEAAIAALPEKRRAVFELCFLQELTHREAAAVLGISPKTVEHQMGHALKTLREKLRAFAE